LIRTVVAEDLRLVRAGLVALLASETDIEVVADLASIDQVVPVALVARPDVLVLDLDAWQEEGINRPRLPVDWIDTRGDHPNEHLCPHRSWTLDLDQAQHFGSAERFQPDSAHMCRQPCHHRFIGR
jgi:hypothetical protein